MITFQTGNLLAFHGKCAIVQSVSKDKIEIRIEGSSTKSVRAKDVEYIHPGPCSVPVVRKMDLPDMEEILELMEEEIFPFREFCELLFGSYSPEAAWSAYCLLTEGLYFTGSVENGVKARSGEEIRKALEEIREKDQAKARYEALLDRIRNNVLLEEDKSALSPVEAFALGKTPSCKLLKDLEIELLVEKAHALLLRTGYWSDLVNPYPERLEVDLTVPEFELGPQAEEERRDLTMMRALAIDNAGSDDPDDAISFHDGVLWVHVADPASVVTPGSPADEFACSAGENLYLPTGVIPMLPEEALARFGLGLQEITPALSFGIKIGEDGSAQLLEMCRSLVRVERFTYESAALLMEESPLKEIRESLERFKQYRLDRGALLIRLPEVQIRVDEDSQIRIRECSITPERELVANAMLAAGAAVGSFALEKEIPMPFASQDEVEERLEGKTLAEMYQQRKLCTPGFVTTSASPHAGLGLDAYIRVTSPLRRYSDLLAHQQLRRYMDGLELMSVEELDDKIATAEKSSAIRRKAERYSNEFFTLVHLKRQTEWTGEAVVVHHINDNTNLLIPALAYEFKNKACNQIALNSVIRIRLVQADPCTLTSRFQVIKE